MRAAWCRATPAAVLRHCYDLHNGPDCTGTDEVLSNERTPSVAGAVGRAGRPGRGKSERTRFKDARGPPSRWDSRTRPVCGTATEKTRNNNQNKTREEFFVYLRGRDGGGTARPRYVSARSPRRHCAASRGRSPVLPNAAAAVAAAAFSPRTRDVRVWAGGTRAHLAAPADEPTSTIAEHRALPTPSCRPFRFVSRFASTTSETFSRTTRGAFTFTETLEKINFPIVFKYFTRHSLRFRWKT